jgi:large subunit ribosomal protein L30
MVYAAIRVRGMININPDIKQTLKLLRLNKVNHCVLLKENVSIKGMLQLVKDYITWGEIEKDMLFKLIQIRGKLEGGRTITDDHIKSATSYSNIEKLSQAVISGKISYEELSNIKPIFRLSPPRKGYKSIKRSFKNKGDLGYRGKEINILLERMI